MGLVMAAKQCVQGRRNTVQDANQHRDSSGSGLVLPALAVQQPRDVLAQIPDHGRQQDNLNPKRAKALDRQDPARQDRFVSE